MKKIVNDLLYILLQIALSVFLFSAFRFQSALLDILCLLHTSEVRYKRSLPCLPNNLLNKFVQYILYPLRSVHRILCLVVIVRKFNPNLIRSIYILYHLISVHRILYLVAIVRKFNPNLHLNSFDSMEQGRTKFA